MQSHQLLNSFDQALGWNALFYGIYKFLTTLLTLMLYTKLSIDSFSLYANVHSIIFILLLWLDCGFKKSIARFCPEYAQNNNALRSFVLRIICFKAMLLACTIPLCQFALNHFVATLSTQTNIIVLATALFVVEGMVSLLQLVYQAHFWHRYFNAIGSAILAVQMMISCTVAYYSTSSMTILLTILYTKIVAGTLICVVAGVLLIYLCRQYTPQKYTKNLNKSDLNRSFVQHSAIMWTSNNLKSLTERNVMVPLLTHIFGQSQANIFKVANDSALFFYRIILKTIGSTDTALLAHAKAHSINSMQVFGYLHRKIMILVSCVFGLFLIVIGSKYINYGDITILQLFACITIGYLIEVALSPYERILEVDQEYADLFKAYAPYIALLPLLFLTNMLSELGLLMSIGIIQSSRIISALLIKHYANQKVAQKSPQGIQGAFLMPAQNKKVF